MQHGMDNSVVSKNRFDGSMFGQFQLKAPALAKRMALFTFAPPSFHQMNSWRREDECREQVFGCESYSEGTYISSWRKQRFSWCLVESDFWWTGSGQEAHCVPRELHEEVRVWWLLSRAKKKKHLPLRKEKPRRCAHVAVEQLAFSMGWMWCAVENLQEMLMWLRSRAHIPPGG